MWSKAFAFRVHDDTPEHRGTSALGKPEQQDALLVTAVEEVKIAL
jgi:hypothetical protein